MKTIIKTSLVAAMALSGLNASSLSAKLSALETELADLKKEVKKQKKKLNKVKAHDANDNIKWGVDLRTSIDNINYDMADGSKRGKNDLMSTRLWLNMEYAPDNKNVFKGQLSYNKAFGADFRVTPDPSLNPFGARGFGFDTFDWVTQEALTGNALKVRQAYWLYLGDSFFGTDIPWTFSVGRRPSTNGFLVNLRDDDAAASPLGHIINVEFDGLSSKLDLSGVTGVSGMSFKLCMGQGSTNASPRLGNLSSTDYANDDTALEDTKLAGFIFEPYNDGQYIVKTTAFRAYSMPGFDTAGFFTAFSGGAAQFSQAGDMAGAAISVLVDGLTEEGYFADAKIFGSFAWSKSLPNAGEYMFGLDPAIAGPYATGAAAGESKTGTSYWFGAQLPVTEKSVFGIEYNHGSKYWRPFSYAEDSFGGAKLAARGDAFEVYYTYQLTDALSAQFRYTSISYDYTGSNGFFGAAGTPFDIEQMKAGAAAGDPTMQAFAAMTVEKSQDARFYIRYRF